MMFAQTATTSDIGLWVLIAILVINGLGAAGGLVAIFATRREVEAIEKRRTAEIESMEKRLNAAEKQRDLDQTTGSERRAKIYAELKSQREDFQHEIKGCYDRCERIEKAFSDTVRHLPNEIIATLRNTGVIK